MCFQKLQYTMFAPLGFYGNLFFAVNTLVQTISVKNILYFMRYACERRKRILSMIEVLFVLRWVFMPKLCALHRWLAMLFATYTVRISYDYYPLPSFSLDVTRLKAIDTTGAELGQFILGRFDTRGILIG